MTDAKRDNNRVTTLLGVSSVDGLTPTEIYVNPSTGAILVDGVAGPQGSQGNQGAVGAQGNQGVQGVQGIQGVQGNQGNQGSQGDVGAQGAQGNQGDVGAQGNQGNQGLSLNWKGVWTYTPVSGTTFDFTTTLSGWQVINGSALQRDANGAYGSDCYSYHPTLISGSYFRVEAVIVNAAQDGIGFGIVPSANADFTHMWALYPSTSKDWYKPTANSVTTKYTSGTEQISATETTIKIIFDNGSISYYNAGALVETYSAAHPSDCYPMVVITAGRMKSLTFADAP